MAFSCGASWCRSPRPLDSPWLLECGRVQQRREARDSHSDNAATLDGLHTALREEPVGRTVRQDGRAEQEQDGIVSSLRLLQASSIAHGGCKWVLGLCSRHRLRFDYV